MQPSLVTRANAQECRRHIALIGIGCRFPGEINTPNDFWQVLHDARDAVEDAHTAHGDDDMFLSRWQKDLENVVPRRGGFLRGIEQFDPSAFGISPREAMYMDPQQRLLLEVAWEALEDAGLVIPQLAGSRTGVFVGMWSNDYAEYIATIDEKQDFYTITGGARYAASGRLSHVFNLCGPSLTIDCASSSSLVAVHLACQSLQSGECSLALAAGVNLILQPSISLGYTSSGILSPDGYCKFADDSANGYVRSEGVGLVVLKPLTQALADNDPIYGIIRGSAVMNAGRASQLLATPSQQAQELLLKEAYQNASIAPAKVQYIEAHGTGTAAGDKVELQSLGNVLNEERDASFSCFVGSVKTNIGHTEAAAGIAGLIKVALCLKHQAIPASLHMHVPNTRVSWEQLPFVIPQKLLSWPVGQEPALAGVSSFGIAGTNAHVVLQEAPRLPPVQAQEHWERAEILPISAHNESTLTALVASYKTFLFSASATDLRNICYSAGTRRSHLAYRLAIVGRSREEFVEACSMFLRDQQGSVHEYVQGEASKVVFVFSGQGTQWLGMGKKLLEEEPVFCRVLEHCDILLYPFTGWSLIAEITANLEQSRLHLTEVAQPVLFALQVALAELWQSWGIVPDAVVGHSVGELAAACVAGVLSLEDAIHIVAYRGQLMQCGSGKGKMAQVEGSLEEAEQLLERFENDLCIAAHNSPTSLVLSGDAQALDKALHLWGKPYVILSGEYAFHSTLMDPVQKELFQRFQGLQTHVPRVPIVSSVTGRLEDGTVFNAQYWAHNVRKRVRFATAIDTLVAEKHTVYLEISPHPTLLRPLRQCLKHHKIEGVLLPSLARDKDERTTMLESLATLYTIGHEVNWQQLYGKDAQYIHLPSYPWQRQRFWLEGVREKALRSSLSVATHPVNTPEIRTDALGQMPQKEDSASQERGAYTSLTYEKLRVAPLGERLAMLERYVSENVASILGMPVSQLRLNQSFISLGFDSLMVLEFIYQIKDGLALEISPVMLIEYPTISRMAQVLHTQITAALVTEAVTSEDEADMDALLTKLKQLSDEEVDLFFSQIAHSKEQL